MGVRLWGMSGREQAMSTRPKRGTGNYVIARGKPADIPGRINGSEAPKVNLLERDALSVRGETSHGHPDDLHQLRP